MVDSWVFNDDESESEAKTNSGPHVCLFLVKSPHFACVEHAQCPLLAHCVSTSIQKGRSTFTHWKALPMVGRGEFLQLPLHHLYVYSKNLVYTLKWVMSGLFTIRSMAAHIRNVPSIFFVLIAEHYLCYFFFITNTAQCGTGFTTETNAMMATSENLIARFITRLPVALGTTFQSTFQMLTSVFTFFLHSIIRNHKIFTVWQ